MTPAQTTTVPVKLLADRRVGRIAVRLWTLLRETPQLSVRQMARELDCSPDAAGAACKALRRSGWVAVLEPPTKVQAARYRVNFDPA